MQRLQLCLPRQAIICRHFRILAVNKEIIVPFGDSDNLTLEEIRRSFLEAENGISVHTTHI